MIPSDPLLWKATVSAHPDESVCRKPAERAQRPPRLRPSSWLGRSGPGKLLSTFALFWVWLSEPGKPLWFRSLEMTSYALTCKELWNPRIKRGYATRSNICSDPAVPSLRRETKVSETLSLSSHTAQHIPTRQGAGVGGWQNMTSAHDFYHLLTVLLRMCVR